MDINYRSLTTLIYEKTGQKICENDPVFLLVVLNHAILEEYLNAAGASTKQHIDEARQSLASEKEELEQLLASECASLNRKIGELDERREKIRQSLSDYINNAKNSAQIDINTAAVAAVTEALKDDRVLEKIRVEAEKKITEINRIISEAKNSGAELNFYSKIILYTASSIISSCVTIVLLKIFGVF